MNQEPLIDQYVYIDRYLIQIVSDEQNFVLNPKEVINRNR